MNTRIALVIGLLTLSLVSVKGSDQPPPQISVTGSAEVKVAPDEVDLNVGVETRDPDLATAKQKNDDGIARALNFLKEQGVPDKDVQTACVTIQPVYDDYNRPSIEARLKPLYYEVRKSIGIKMTNVAGFDAILTGLMKSGVNFVQGIDFRTSELRKYKDQARGMAIKAAKEKAVAMAEDLGVKVGKPNNISVNDWGGWTSWAPGGWGFGGGANMMQNVSQNNGAGSGENGPTMSVGQISISASVSVTFLIQ